MFGLKRITALLLVSCLALNGIEGLAAVPGFPPARTPGRFLFNQQALSIPDTWARNAHQPSAYSTRHWIGRTALALGLGISLLSPPLTSRLQDSSLESALSPAGSRVTDAEEPARAHRLANYFSTLRALSTNEETYIGLPFFGTNEAGHQRFFEAVQGRGGAMLGVSYQQTFNFAIHGRADVYFILDINRMVTEVLVPFTGYLMDVSPTRHEFLLRLTGVSLSDTPLKQLIEPGLDENHWDALASEVVFTNLPRHREDVRRIFTENLLPHLSLTTKEQDEALGYLENLTTYPHGSLREFLRNQVEQPWESGFDASKLHSTWLSSEENYQAARKAWQQGKFRAVSGNLLGRSVPKIADYLRARDVSVSMVYVSNVPQIINTTQENERHGFSGGREGIQQLYANLDNLPMRADAMFFQADYSPNTRRLEAEVLPYSVARKRKSPGISLFPLFFPLFPLIFGLAARGKSALPGETPESQAAIECIRQYYRLYIAYLQAQEAWIEAKTEIQMHPEVDFRLVMEPLEMHLEKTQMTAIELYPAQAKAIGVIRRSHHDLWLRLVPYLQKIVDARALYDHALDDEGDETTLLATQQNLRLKAEELAAQFNQVFPPDLPTAKPTTHLGVAALIFLGAPLTLPPGWAAGIGVLGLGWLIWGISTIGMAVLGARLHKREPLTPGQYLSLHMRKANLNSSQLGRQIAIHRFLVSGYLHDKHVTPYPVAQKLAKTLDFSLDYYWNDVLVPTVKDPRITLRGSAHRTGPHSLSPIIARPGLIPAGSRNQAVKNYRVYLNLLAARVRKKRIERGLTQVELADRAGMTQNVVSKIELGMGVRLSACLSIAEGLGVTPESLLDPRLSLALDPLPAPRRLTFRRIGEALARWRTSLFDVSNLFRSRRENLDRLSLNQSIAKMKKGHDMIMKKFFSHVILRGADLADIFKSSPKPPSHLGLGALLFLGMPLVLPPGWAAGIGLLGWGWTLVGIIALGMATIGKQGSSAEQGAPAKRFIIDIGAGAGGTTRFLARENPQAQISLVEPVPEKMRAAKKRLSNFSNIVFVNTLFEDWNVPLRLGLADAIYFIYPYFADAYADYAYPIPSLHAARIAHKIAELLNPGTGEFTMVTEISTLSGVFKLALEAEQLEVDGLTVHLADLAELVPAVAQSTIYKISLRSGDQKYPKWNQISILRARHPAGTPPAPRTGLLLRAA